MRTVEMTLALLLLAAVTAPAAAERPDPGVPDAAGLHNLRATYVKTRAGINDQFEERKADALGAYANAVRRHEEDMRHRGELEETLAARKERKRLEAEHVAPKADDTAFPPGLAALLQQHSDAVAGAHREREDQMIHLLKRYSARLLGAQKSLTSRDRLELAVGAKREREHIEFLLSEIENGKKTAEDWERERAKEKASLARRARLHERARNAIDWNGHFYKLFVGSVSWHVANRECTMMGGHMVTISSEEENRLVTRIAAANRSESKNVWIGCTDDRREGRWEWVTEEPFSFANWRPGQPGGGRAENYGVLQDPKPGASGLWNDAPAGEKSGEGKNYICEWDF